MRPKSNHSSCSRLYFYTIPKSMLDRFLFCSRGKQHCKFRINRVFAGGTKTLPFLIIFLYLFLTCLVPDNFKNSYLLFLNFRTVFRIELVSYRVSELDSRLDIVKGREKLGLSKYLSKTWRPGIQSFQLR